MVTETLQSHWYRWWPSHLIGELLAKRWTETAVPFFVLLIVTWGLSAAIPGLLQATSLADMARQYGEVGLVVLGLALVMIGGGVDISLGSIFALANLAALAAVHLGGYPAWAGVAVGVGTGAALGAVNGVLVGYLRLRAFITTLTTLILYRAVYDLLNLRFATAITGVSPESAAWDRLGNGDVLGLPVSAWALALVALFGHVMLTRLRYGWHVAAIGGGRRSSHNAGLPVRGTVASTYVVAGALTGLSAAFFAARLASVGSDTGMGREITVLTAAVLGGISLGGGKGSVAMALIGGAVVLLLTNGMIRLGASGGATRIVLASVLLLAVMIDVRWNKNRHRIVNKVYLSPTYLRLPASPLNEPVYRSNKALSGIRAIGAGEVEGPEDVILDEDDHLYCGTRHGEIMRFRAPDYMQKEVFARIGGHPLGMAFDREGRLYTCVGGMGLYYVERDGTVKKATDETNRHWLSVTDDSRMRIADDLDIAPDGRVFFSEATTLFEIHEWAQDSLEARGNGRIVCYDPATRTTRTVLRGLVFPNGVCVASDGQSILFAETRACRIRRWWFDGPRKGELITVIDSLPGYPDNINRSSYGNYWLALIGVRTPTFDLALRPNRLLDEGEVVAHAGAGTDLVAYQGRIWLADGTGLREVGGDEAAAGQGQPIVAAAAFQGQLAIGLEDGTVRVLSNDCGVRDELRGAGAPSALAFEDGNTVLVARASARHAPADFARSLLEKERSGAVARWTIGEAAAAPVAENLAYAYGVAPVGGGRTDIAQSWRHRLVARGPGGELSAVLDDLPAYPSRITRSRRGGWWLTCFCARFQLLEFVLRERRYRSEMMRTVEPAFWIAPRLRSGQDWREPLQGAGIQQMGVRKPWAPPRSYGLVIYLDAEFRPRASLHSRADGIHHGIVAAAEAANGDLYVLSAGAQAVLKIRSETLASLMEGNLT